MQKILDIELLQHIRKFADENKINLKDIHLLELRKFFNVSKLRSVDMRGKYGLQYTYVLPVKEARDVYKNITETLKKLEYSKKKKCKRYFTKVYKVWNFKDRKFISTDLGVFEEVEQEFYKVDGNFKVIVPNIRMNDKEKKDVLAWII